MIGIRLFDQHLKLILLLFQCLELELDLLANLTAEVGATQNGNVKLVIVVLVEADSFGGVVGVEGIFFRVRAGLQTFRNYNLFQALLNFSLIEEVFSLQPANVALLSFR